MRMSSEQDALAAVILRWWLARAEQLVRASPGDHANHLAEALVKSEEYQQIKCGGGDHHEEQG